MPLTLFPGVALVTGAAASALPMFYIQSLGLGIDIDIDIDIDIESARKESDSQHPSSLPSKAVPKLRYVTTTMTGFSRSRISDYAELLVCAVDTSQEEHVWGIVQKCVAEWGWVDYACQSPRHLAFFPGRTAPDAEVRAASDSQWAAREQRQYCEYCQPARDGFEARLTKTAVYCASKAAVISLTKSDAIDYSKYYIWINCICLGVIA
ncbi:NAD(P)-binding protein [Diplocarpon rosae]|nr:NAD(P)-binding protein [Diplocarpon rosae]